MPAKDHAAWDVGSATRRSDQLREPAPEELRDLASDRIAFLAAALTKPDEVRAEYERRTRVLASPSIEPFRRLPLILLVAAWLALFAGLALNGLTRVSPLHFWIMVATLSALTAARNRRRWFGPARHAHARRCPDCGYDLSASHAEPPLDFVRLRVDLGPQHCPECGAFWPLVPPAELGPVAQTAPPEPPCSSSSTIEDGGGRQRPNRCTGEPPAVATRG